MKDKKKIVVFGGGLVARIFVYFLIKKINEQKCSLSGIKNFFDIDIDFSIYDKINDRSACFYFHNFIDNLLTPECMKIRVKTTCDLSMYYYDSINRNKENMELNYLKKVFGKDINEAFICNNLRSRSISELNKSNSVIKKEGYYFDNNTLERINHYFKKSIVVDCVRDYRLNYIGGKSEKRRRALSSPTFFYEYIKDKNYVIWTKPLYELENVLYCHSSFEIWPIGLMITPINPISDTSFNKKRDYSLEVIYDTDLCEKYYRTTFDYKGLSMIREYSLSYKNNVNTVYDQVIYPGKIVSDLNSKSFKELIDKDNKIKLLGRYAEWKPGLLITDCIDKINSLVSEIVEG